MPQIAFSFALGAAWALLALSVAAAVARSAGPKSTSRKSPFRNLTGAAVAVAVAGALSVAQAWDPLTAAIAAGALGVMLIETLRYAARGWSLGQRAAALGAELALGAAVSQAMFFLQGATIFGVPRVLDAVLAAAITVTAARSLRLIDGTNGAGAAFAAIAAGCVAALSVISSSPLLGPAAAALSAACLVALGLNLRARKAHLGAPGAAFCGFMVAALTIALPLPAPPGRPIAVACLFAVPLAASIGRMISRWLGGTDSGYSRRGDAYLSTVLSRVGVSGRKAALVQGLVTTVAVAGVLLSVNNESLGPAAAVLTMTAAMAAVAGLVGIGPRPARKAPVLLTGIAVAAMAGLAIAAAPTLGAHSDLEKARELMVEGATATGSFQIDRADAAFAAAAGRAQSAQNRLESGWVSPAKLVPFIRQNVQSAQVIASATMQIAEAARQALDAAQAITGGRGGPILSEGRIDLSGFGRAQELLSEAAERTRIGVQQVRSTSSFVIPMVADARDTFIERGSEAARTLQNAADATAIIPDMLGASGRRTWFLAIQNGAELRATGGLIGAFGILTAEEGRITLQKLESDRSLPVLRTEVEAPEFIRQRYDRFQSRRLWSNVNMTPDFPTAAQMIAAMWQQSTGQKIDGVMGIDASGIAGLLDATGPVNIPELSTEISSENFIPVVLSDAYSVLPDRGERQDILVDVGRELWGRLLSGQFSIDGPLPKSLGKSIHQKHLMLWSEPEGETLRNLGVTGELAGPSAGGDYLFVVGQNTLGDKLDYFGRRQVTYDARINPQGDVNANLKIAIDNRTPAQGVAEYALGVFGSPNLGSYISAYLGPGAEVSSAEIDGRRLGVESHIELGLPVFSRFLETERGTQSEISMNLFRPRIAEDGHYHLLVQRQPALYPDQLTVRITPPEGAQIISVTGGLTAEDGSLVWSGPLDADREFSVTFSAAR